MMKILIRIMAVLLCLMLFMSTAFAADETIENKIKETGKALSQIGGSRNVISDSVNFPPGNSLTDWTVIALAFSGTEGDYAKYADSLRKHIEQKYAEEGFVNDRKATEYHRIILTALALGEDPSAFGKNPDGQSIDLLNDGIFNFVGGNLGKQGLNGYCYGLIALNASGVTVPENAEFTEETIAASILSAQEADGGFGLIPGSSDADMTAMAIQALAPYRAEYPEEIEAAVNCLAGMMNDSCGFSADGSDSAESIAQVIIALCSLGIDPQEDMRFVRGRTDLVSSLERFRNDDGTYRHMTDSTENDCYATAQSLLALIALNKLQDHQAGLYSLENYRGPYQRASAEWIYILTAAIVVIIAGIIVVILRKRKGNNGKTYR